MAGETPLTVVGNLVDSPELRYTPSGKAVAKFRVATNERVRDQAGGGWKDGGGLFLACVLWGPEAEYVADLVKGTRVIVKGRLKQRSYEANDGSKRTVMELEVDEIGPAMRYARVEVHKVAREAGGSWSDEPAGF